MSGRKVTVIDYGLGNLFSVSRALEKAGAELEVTDSASRILEAERLILPGVGACADGMEGLRQRGLIEPVRKYAASGRPFLGICLGMQMLLDSSEEFGTHEGLGIIPGKVAAIPPTDASGKPHKIPHIGWNQLLVPGGQKWDGTIFSSTPERSFVYFVHSFAAVPSDDKYRLADCDYNGRRISAAIRSGNVFGCQFHPEKSGPVGLKIIQSFLSLA